MTVADLIQWLAGLPPMMEVMCMYDHADSFFINGIEFDSDTQPPIALLLVDHTKQSPMVTSGWQYNTETQRYDRILTDNH